MVKFFEPWTVVQFFSQEYLHEGRTNFKKFLSDRKTDTGVMSSYFLGITYKAPRMFCFEICTPEGRGGKWEGVQISKQGTQNL